jgi:hypothetical protein
MAADTVSNCEKSNLGAAEIGILVLGAHCSRMRRRPVTQRGDHGVSIQTKVALCGNLSP